MMVVIMFMSVSVIMIMIVVLEKVTNLAQVRGEPADFLGVRVGRFISDVSLVIVIGV